MKPRIAFLLSVAMSALFTLSSAFAAPAHFPDFGSRIYSATVVGKVHFEARATLHSMLCTSTGCARSERYWTLVIHRDQTDYEINQPFAKGSAAAPETIEMNGVVIRPGATVSLNAQVEPISENFSVLTEVKNLSLVTDRSPHVMSWGSRPPLHGVEHPTLTTQVMTHLWNCGTPDRGVNVQAEIWHKDASPKGQGYLLRLSAVSITGGHPLVSFPDAKAKVDHQKTIWAGTSPEVQAELELEHSDRVLSGAGGFIKIHRGTQLSNSDLPPEYEGHIWCERADSDE